MPFNAGQRERSLPIVDIAAMFPDATSFGPFVA
jgi:hypothetical protein